jgi:hypothetical protein
MINFPSAAEAVEGQPNCSWYQDEVRNTHSQSIWLNGTKNQKGERGRSHDKISISGA